MNEQGTSIRETAASIHGKEKKKTNTTKDQGIVEGSIEALQAENERLRMENAYLKKLNALVQNKEKSRNKTKPK
ncbi:Tnp167A [Bacillus pseudomycoides DSM 12442]|nr:Tnp167A [Bacillus pseudomycoides DSM 12442]OOR52636.1 transposase [Bacillus pseudomycoides]